MSPVVQIAAATLMIAFVAFLAYGALTESRKRPAAGDSGAPKPPETPGETPGDSRAGGEAFRKEALAAADDPLQTGAPPKRRN